MNHLTTETTKRFLNASSNPFVVSKNFKTYLTARLVVLKPIRVTNLINEVLKQNELLRHSNKLSNVKNFTTFQT